MARITSNEGEPGETPETGEASFEESLLDDSFLKWVVQEGMPYPLPVLGERLGGGNGQRYEVVGRLGGGAMGQVFRALDHELQRTVALKFLSASPEFSDSWLATIVRREAKAIAQLDHENILRIHDMAEWDTGLRAHDDTLRMKVPFLVMEYLRGESLRSLMRRGRPELPRALELMSDVAAGLAHAHERQLIHRDLKPSNIFVLTNGRAKLLDFGLARLLGGSTLAHERDMAGTPVFMAPELWRGELADARVDVWAAGLILFELLTGHNPLFQYTIPELHERITSDEPLPLVRELRPELPAEVTRLVAAALAKDRTKRLANGTELANRLHELRKHLSHHPAMTRRGAPQRVPVTLVYCRLTFAAMADRSLEPETYDELETTFHRLCTGIILEHGGQLITSAGAQVLACFGHSGDQEDAPERALRAALRLTTPREHPALSLHGYAVKVGVHTDRVILNEAPATIQGEAVEIAGWLASQAEPNSVLFSESTRALLRGHFASDCLGQRSFRALSRTVRMDIHRVHPWSAELGSSAP